MKKLDYITIVVNLCFIINGNEVTGQNGIITDGDCEYYFSDKQQFYSELPASCPTNFSALAMPKTEKQRIFLKNHILNARPGTKNNYFIGGRFKNGSWIWADRDDFNQAPSAGGKGFDSTGCAIINANNTISNPGVFFTSFDCEAYARYFACERSIASTSPCSPNPCMNQAVCSQIGCSFNCSCVAGYTGYTCDIDIDDCVSNPCSYGGTCTDRINSYECNCKAGYTGGQCKIDINDCESAPCKNGASCIDGINNYTCNCASGYTGRNCSIDIDDCEPNPCQNGGTCRDFVNDFRCSCIEGLTGRTCKNDTTVKNKAGNCRYYFSRSKEINQVNAWRACKNRFANSQLAMFKTTEQQKFAREKIKKIYSKSRNYFLGGNLTNSIWSWNDGDRMNPDLGKGKPSCVAINPTQTNLQRVSCTNHKYYACEQQIGNQQACIDGPCLNGGTCEEFGCGFRCICASNFFGHKCDEEVLEINVEGSQSAIEGTTKIFNFEVIPHIPGSIICDVIFIGKSLLTTQNITSTTRINYTLDDIQMADSGGYLLKCTIQPENQQTSITAFGSVTLDVHVPANISITPSRLELQRNNGNQNPSATCTSRGNPRPTATWFRTNAAVTFTTGSIHQKRSSKNATSVIYFTNGNFNDSGEYVCSATNYIGLPSVQSQTNATLNVKVIGIPEISPLTRFAGLPSNNNVQFSCIFEGVPLPNITWRFINDKSIPDTNQFQITEMKLTPFRIKSVLTVYGTSCKEVSMWKFVCLGSNSLTSDPIKSEEFVSDIDNSILQPNITVGSNICEGTGMTIIWSLLPKASTFQHKLIYYTTSRASSVTQLINPGITQFLATGLTQRTTYSIQVFTQFDGCQNASSNVTTSFTTRGPLLPPKNVTFSYVRPTNICCITWETPRVDEEEIGGYIIRYTEQVRSRRSTSQITQPVIITTNVPRDSLRFKLVLLTPNTNYGIEVGVYASNPCRSVIGNSFTKIVSDICVTDLAAPGEITISSTKPTTNQNNQILLTINPVSERNGIISCYFIIVQQVINERRILIEKDPNFIQQGNTNNNTESYVAVAVSGVTMNGSLVLGDSETTCCDVTGKEIKNCLSNNQENRRRRQANSIITAHNKPLSQGSMYQYYIITATPASAGDVIYATSPASEPFDVLYIPDAGSNPILAILILPAILVILIVILIYKRESIVAWKRGENTPSPWPAVEVIPPIAMGEIDANNVQHHIYDDVAADVLYENVNTNTNFVKYTITGQDLLSAYNKKRQDGDKIFNEEFKTDLPKIVKAVAVSTTYARNANNIPKNRYKNISPSDGARVVIKKLPNDPYSDYINASYINGFDKEKRFIAAQGPKSTTVNDFWRMIIENDCKIIVMLTLIEEKKRDKCAKYWPDLGNEAAHGVINVKNIEEVTVGEYMRRTIEAVSPKKSLRIQHYQFLSWPDHGTPDTTTALIHLHNEVVYQSRHDDCPIVVHCSAGCGRTGTFVGLDIMKDELSRNGCVNFVKCVYDMRLNRSEMIQGVGQYILLHKMIAEYQNLAETDLNVSDFLTYVQQLTTYDESTNTKPLKRQFDSLSLIPPFRTAAVKANSRQSRLTYKHATSKAYDHNAAFVNLVENDGTPVYINASNIRAYTNGYYFIVAEDPQPNTIDVFWKCVLDNGVNLIVMLAENQASCMQYWASNSDKVWFNDVSVHTTKVVEKPGYVENTLKVNLQQSAETYTIKQIILPNWTTDKGRIRLPNISTVIEVLALVEMNMTETNPFIALFHCSDGSDKCGTMCGMANILDRLKNENKIDVFRTIKDLRDERENMVGCEANYEFCYKVVAEYVQSFDLYGNFK